MKLNAHNATLKTAQVEIKTLTLSGKQVTLAVFRQLEERELLFYNKDLGEFMFSGIPWGRVNYCPDKCGSYSPHLHVIWQLEDKLYRSIVYSSIYSWDYGNGKTIQKRSLDELKAAAKLYENTFSELLELDQLFIAV